MVLRKVMVLRRTSKPSKEPLLYLLDEADFPELQAAVDQTLLLRLSFTEPAAVGFVLLASFLLVRRPASSVQTLLPERKQNDGTNENQ